MFQLSKFIICSKIFIKPILISLTVTLSIMVQHRAQVLRMLKPEYLVWCLILEDIENLRHGLWVQKYLPPQVYFSPKHHKLSEIQFKFFWILIIHVKIRA